MDKPFMTYEQMLDKLILEKKLVVDNRQKAVQLLKENSYFSLICGYKKPFKAKNGNYKKNVKFEDIYALYDFDNELRQLFLSYILKVENHIKSLISYSFCSMYGADQAEYLNTTNYNYVSKNQNTINRLVQKLGEIANSNNVYRYIDHQRSKHGNVPLWVTMKALTLGTVSKMYGSLTSAVQSQISKEFPGISESSLSNMLKYSTKIRNVCAHNERLFDYKSVKNMIADTEIHQKLGARKNSQYTQGKNDLFAMVIILKYLLSEKDFNDFFFFLKRQIDVLCESLNVLQRPQLYKYMGFPSNWETIKDIRKIDFITG